MSCAMGGAERKIVDSFDSLEALEARYLAALEKARSNPLRRTPRGDQREHAVPCRFCSMPTMNLYNCCDLCHMREGADGEGVAS